MLIRIDQDGGIMALIHSPADTDDISQFELLGEVPDGVFDNPAGYVYIDGVFSEKPSEHDP